MSHFFILLSLLLIFSELSLAKEAPCTKNQARDAVQRICDLAALSREQAVEEVKTFRYCESNYVWIQDVDLKMVIHPINPKLDNAQLSKKKDAADNWHFLSFDRAAKANPEGAWVDFTCIHPDNNRAGKKVGFAKQCSGYNKWIVVTGIWQGL